MILLLPNINILCNCILWLAYPAIQSMLQLVKINKHLSIHQSSWLASLDWRSQSLPSTDEDKRHCSKRVRWKTLHRVYGISLYLIDMSNCIETGISSQLPLLSNPFWIVSSAAKEAYSFTGSFKVLLWSKIDSYFFSINQKYSCLILTMPSFKSLCPREVWLIER